MIRTSDHQMEDSTGRDAAIVFTDIPGEKLLRGVARTANGASCRRRSARAQHSPRRERVSEWMGGECGCIYMSGR